MQCDQPFGGQKVAVHGTAWTQHMTQAIFHNGHQNQIIMGNLGEVGLNKHMQSDHFASMTWITLIDSWSIMHNKYLA